MNMGTEKETMIYSTAAVAGRTENIGNYAIATVVNELAAKGGREPEVYVHLLLPEKLQRPHVYCIEKKIKKICAEQGINLLEIRESIQAQISEYTVTASGVDRAPKEEPWYRETMRAGQDIVLTKWIGTEGMLRILEEQNEELARRFTPAFLNQAAAFGAGVFAGKEAELAREKGAVKILPVSEGGIFAALWKLAEEAGSGLEVDLKKISIRQETIEVCEHFRMNPYQLASSGCLLIVAEDGRMMTDAFAEAGVHASVIGRLRGDRDKIIRNGEDVRYIDRPAPDEINKLYSGGYDERD